MLGTKLSSIGTWGQDDKHGGAKLRRYYEVAFLLGPTS